MNRSNIRKHKYTIGGALSLFNKSATSKLYGTKFGQGLLRLGISLNNIGGIGNVASLGIGSIMNPRGNSTGVGKGLLAVGTLASVIPGVGGLIGAGVNLIGGLVNSAFGSKINLEFVDLTRELIGQQANYVSGANTNTDLLDEWALFQDLGLVLKSLVGSDGWFSNKASRLTRNLNANIDASNLRAKLSLANTALNIDVNNDLLALANYSAYGGPINMRYSGVMSPFGNRFAEGGGIHIKPSKRGTFTAAAKKHGKSVLAFASLVLANKDNYSPAMVKKANFARNFGGRKRAYGGPLLSNGTDWDNGIIYIGNGGTHELNPYEGVLIGVDLEGVPNLVELNEIVFGDYVFSDRLHADGDLLQSVNLPKSYKDKSFSEIAKKLGKESQERPNDPISEMGLLSAMSRLLLALEIVRQNMKSLNQNEFAFGGKTKSNKFDGLTSGTMFLDGRDYGGWQDYGALDEPVDIEKMYDEFLRSQGVVDTNGSKLTWLRYAPVIGSAIGLAQNIFSKPDYSTVDAAMKASKEAGNYLPVSYTPIGNYLQYKPFDRDFYINKLNALAGATRRALADLSGGNRATAMAGLLAADYNTQGKLGDLARLAEEYNLALRQAVETFNRQTDLSNAEMGLKAAMANQEALQKSRNTQLSGVTLAMAMKDAIDARRGTSYNANLTNLFDSLGNIGIDAYNRADRDFYIKHVMEANLPLNEYSRLYGKEAAKKEAKARGYSDTEIDSMFKANGGKLRKKRGGFTY